MTYTHNDKLDSVIQELETAQEYLGECIKVLKMFKYEDMRKHMDSRESHLVLDKIHNVFRSVSRFPFINFLDLRNFNK